MRPNEYILNGRFVVRDILFTWIVTSPRVFMPSIVMKSDYMAIVEETRERERRHSSHENMQCELGDWENCFRVIKVE